MDNGCRETRMITQMGLLGYAKVMVLRDILGEIFWVGGAIAMALSQLDLAPYS